MLNRRTSLPPLVVATLFIVFAAPARSQDPPGGQGGAVDLASPERQAGDTERDRYSKPIEVFDWLDIEPGDVVLDFHAGGGYNTWILSQWVGPDGVVFAEMPADYPMTKEFKTRLESGDLRDATNVVFVTSITDLPSDSLDLVFISRNYHDLPPDGIPEFLQHVQRTLKPGGTFAVIDARTPEGRDREAHRIADQVIVDEVTAAGFELEDSSDLLANPEDDHVGPKWDMREQLDQSLMKFRKPAEETEAAETEAEEVEDEDAEGEGEEDEEVEDEEAEDEEAEDEEPEANPYR